MSGWETKRVEELVVGCADGTYVLPAIHMEPIWDDAQIALWFDSLLQGYPGGGIVVLREEAGDLPLFAHRRFARSGEDQPPAVAGTLERTTNLAIDGRQRLQALYSGLLGARRGRVLQLDVLGDEGEVFRFAPESAAGLAGEAGDSARWHSVPALFARLRTQRDVQQTVRELVAREGVTDAERAERIAGNVQRFFVAMMVEQAIAVCVVRADHARRESEQARIVAMFRRLHGGASALPASALDELRAVRIADDRAPSRADSPPAAAHPILADRTTWHAIFAATGARELWVDRYVGELRHNRIETVADFARWIMLCGITVRKKQRQGAVYRFAAPAPDGFLPDLAMTEFGGWAWKVALLEMADRGFDWLEYVVA